MASNLVPITVAHGDGIGPEIMAASLHILKEAGARIETETIEIGEKVYLRRIDAGIEPTAWESLRRTKDVFLQWNERNAHEFGRRLEQFNGDGIKLKSLSNRGVKVYPDGFEETFCTDHWRAGFLSEKENGPVTHQQVVNLLDRLQRAGLDFIKIENLYTFDGQKGFVAAQGE